MPRVICRSLARLHRGATPVISLALVLVCVLTLIQSAPAQAADAISPDPATLAVQNLPAAESDASIEAAIAAARSGKWIEIRLASQRLYAWQNGRLVMSSLISSGVARYPTRRGTFRIYVKYRSTRMRGPGYNLPNVPYTMYYSGGYAIHGAYWHHNFGHPMSHGCINLPVSFSRQLYLWAPVGTLVVIH